MSVIDIFDDTDDKLNAFNILYKQILDQHAPIKTIHSSNSIHEW